MQYLFPNSLYRGLVSNFQGLHGSSGSNVPFVLKSTFVPCRLSSFLGWNPHSRLDLVLGSSSMGLRQ